MAPPSLSSVFLCQRGFDLLHLRGKKSLHLLALAVKLVGYLRLQRGNLVFGADGCFIDFRFQSLLVHGKALDLLFEGCKSGIMHT